MKKSYFLLLAVMAIVFAGCKPDVESCFTSTVNDATVTFTSDCSIEAAVYEWDFGDGETSIAANPTHVYDTSGNYTVTLRVSDKKEKNSSTFSETVSVCEACVHGDCVNGGCACDAGYQGADCNTEINAKFDGTYNLMETCDLTGSDAYSLTVVPSTTDLTKATITGLYREFFPVVIHIDADGLSFTIPAVDIGPGTLVSTGTCNTNVSGSNINVIYRFTNDAGTASDNCVAVLTRQ